MTLQRILTDPGSLRTALFCVAGAAAGAALILKRVREKRSGEPRVIRLTLDEPTGPSAPAAGAPARAEAPEAVPTASAALTPPPIQVGSAEAAALSSPEPALQPEVQTAVATSELPESEPLEPPQELAPEVAAEQEPAIVSRTAYTFLTLQQRSPVLMDILRGALIMLAIVAAGALALVVLPQPAVDKMAAALRPRNAPGPPPEKIAFLYLGDEVKDNEFHIRGVVRNITAQAIEQLEAVVRIYAPDHTLLETQVVRMDTDTIFPNAAASFNLSFPDYHGQFGSYSLDFQLAQGDPVPYKDMREAPAGN